MTRVQRVLMEKGLYVPPELSAELEDALKTLAVEQGCVDSTYLSWIKVVFSTEEKNGRTEFIMDVAGIDLPGEFKSIEGHVRENLGNTNTRNARIQEKTSQRIILRGDCFQKVVNSVVEGFINRFMKTGEKVDVEAIMRQHSPQTWERGANTGMGGPGGG